MSLINKNSNIKVSLGWLKTKPGRRSTNDWMLFIVIIFVLITASLVFHLYLFINVDRDSSASASDASSNSLDTLDRTALNKAVEYLESKKTISVNFTAKEIVSTSTINSLPSTRQ